MSQKRPKFETVQREIITIDSEDILQKYSKVPEQSLHFACFRLVSCRFAFLLTFCLSNMTPKITRILTLYQANAPTLTPISKEDKILIKNLYECKGYNARQFITKFLNKDWTKNSINSVDAFMISIRGDKFSQCQSIELRMSLIGRRTCYITTVCYVDEPAAPAASLIRHARRLQYRSKASSSLRVLHYRLGQT